MSKSHSNQVESILGMHRSSSEKAATFGSIADCRRDATRETTMAERLVYEAARPHGSARNCAAKAPSEAALAVET